ncbi:MAG TPA: 3-dehydroquinate synthase [Thermoanaerobaculia bacterium]
MEPIVVASSRGPYRVVVREDAADDLGAVVDEFNREGTRFAVVSRRVLELHRERIERALPGATVLPVDDGEGVKSFAAVEALLDSLIASGARRDSTVIAVGGGSVGDAAGFAASILYRGVDLVHVPTTLLAQVDSSVGGKVAVNHRRGKNLVGSFWPPRAVVSDIAFLKTLPEEELRSGTFEALKAGVIGDEALFELTRAPFHVASGEIVRRAIAVKAAIVSEDEREGDRRRLLNYGHTIGHAIEAALGYGRLTHGDAIAWGMIGANALGAKRGLLDPAERARIDDAVRNLAPKPPREIGPEAVLKAAGLDKKFTDRARVMILARRVGECAIVEVSDEELRYAVEAALAP